MIAFTLAVVAVVVLVVRGVTALPPNDSFDVKELYPTAPGGQTWEAQWDRPITADPWIQLNGNGQYAADNGVLTVSGRNSRVYVRDPALQHQWGNVEITVYAKRVFDGDVPYSGIVTEARTNHGMTGSLEDHPCDSRALSARLRNDGNADFGKETKHPTTIATEPQLVFPEGLPYDQWIGYKHVVYDIPGGTHQELWMDINGAWILVASHNDRKRDDFGEVPCAPGIDPAMPLTVGARPGSESGLPNLSVLFRADEIGPSGLQYRDASVREIVAP